MPQPKNENLVAIVWNVTGAIILLMFVFWMLFWLGR